MRKLNLKVVYIYYLLKILKNKKVNQLLTDILSHDCFKNDSQLRSKIIKIFILGHPYFQSKFIFIYKRYLWEELMSYKHISAMDRHEIWSVRETFLKKWFNHFFNSINNDKVRLIRLLRKKNKKKIIEIINNINKLFIIISVSEKEVKKNLNNINTCRDKKIKEFIKKKKRIFNLRRYEKFFNKKGNIGRHARKRRKDFVKKEKRELLILRKLKYKQIAFLIVKLKLNNIFLTVLNFKGQTIYQCSGGFYGITGQRRVNTHIITRLTKRLTFTLKRFHKLKHLIVVYKSGYKNKLIRSVSIGLRNTPISVLGRLYSYNRPTSILRRRKIRRV